MRYCILLISLWCFQKEGFSQHSCIPVPKDYKIVFKVEDGSLEGVARSLACILGFVYLPDEFLPPETVTITLEKEVPIKEALKMFEEACKRVCFGFNVSKGVARLKFMGCKKKNKKSTREVRFIIEPQRRLVTLTTEQTLDRSILKREEVVVQIGEGLYLIDPQVRELAKQDPLAFVEEGTAFPNILGFPEKGMVIAYLREGGIFRRLGLQVLDIVTHVNGLPLETIGDAFFAYGALRNAEVLLVRLVRGQSIKYLIYRFGKAQ